MLSFEKSTNGDVTIVSLRGAIDEDTDLGAVFKDGSEGAGSIPAWRDLLDQFLRRARVDPGHGTGAEAVRDRVRRALRSDGQAVQRRGARPRGGDACGPSWPPITARPVTRKCRSS